MPETYWHAHSGEWRKREPIGPQGWKARLENWFRKKGMRRLADFIAAWDERGLG
jgi:hypothetical protein